MSVQDSLTVRGYIQALPAVGQESAPRVAIVTEDGKEYQVIHKGEGIHLVSEINANVEATGMVSTCPADQSVHAPDAVVNGDGDFCYFITIQRYRLTDGFDDPWYDDAV